MTACNSEMLQWILFRFAHSLIKFSNNNIIVRENIVAIATLCLVAMVIHSCKSMDYIIIICNISHSREIIAEVANLP